jgi:hypothetical protein
VHDIRDRSDLIALVAKRAPVVSCRRACLTDRVENLGAFLFYGTRGGWVVRVHTTRDHYVSVVPGRCGVQVGVLEQVPWEVWIGDQGEQILYRGDHPEEYRRLWDAAKADDVRCDVGLA